jgi:tRNA-dihydrouridine synthase B
VIASSPIKPIQLGTLELPSNIFHAPLAGCSDFPFRQMCRRYSSGLLYCEMVKMDAIIRSNAASFRMLHYSTDMHPIGAQLCGSNPKLAAAAARVIEDMGFDILDLNCGCPVDKVTQDGSGSGLLRTPARIGEILTNMIAAVRIPVSVKIRVGWDEDHIIVEDLVRMAELAGAKGHYYPWTYSQTGVQRRGEFGMDSCGQTAGTRDQSDWKWRYLLSTSSAANAPGNGM